jgi:hypothetical protein
MQTGRYRNYKNKFYNVIGVALDTATRSKVVLYKALYECPDLKDEYGDDPIFTRPYDEFFGKVEVDGKSVNRFECVE